MRNRICSILHENRMIHSHCVKSIRKCSVIGKYVLNRAINKAKYEAITILTNSSMSKYKDISITFNRCIEETQRIYKISTEKMPRFSKIYGYDYCKCGKRHSQQPGSARKTSKWQRAERKPENVLSAHCEKTTNRTKSR